MLYATVRNRKIHVKKPETVVQNGVNADWLELDMDDEWMDMETIACVFVNRYVDGSEEKEVAKELPLKVVQSGPMSGEAPLGPTEWPGWSELKANI